MSAAAGTTPHPAAGPSLRPAMAGASLRARTIAGVGGIGTGLFFRLEGMHTLGRNESRAAILLPNRDYCKQHIILHYLARLLGDRAAVRPIGAVGDDEAGRTLLAEMAAAGMDVGHVRGIPGLRTLFSVCFQYPDSTGGNITSSNGASAAVSPDDVDRFFAALGDEDDPGLAVAAPETPLETRLRLLARGRERGWLTAAAILPSEAAAFEAAGGFALADVLALNIDEAAAVAGLAADGADGSGAAFAAAEPAFGESSAAGPAAASRGLARRCAERIADTNPSALVVVTDGPRGSYSWAGGELLYTPPLPVPEAASTAGAGDAFLAGALAGLVCGLPPRKTAEDAFFGATPLASAVELGTLLASFSVTSPDTIHRGADARTLRAYAGERGLALAPAFAAMFAAAD